MVRLSRITCRCCWRGTPGRNGTLQGHVARANPLWRSVAEGAEVLVVFRGADAYISPSSYPSKRTDGKVVPTWNYSVVHARGTIRFFDDEARLHALVSNLTDRFERDRPEPWAVSDAPADYVRAMLRAIVGFEIEITELVGKFKASQNRSAEDRAGVRGRAGRGGRRRAGRTGARSRLIARRRPPGASQPDTGIIPWAAS